MTYKTRQREEIAEYLASIPGKHVTAGDICAHFQTQGSAIGAATVYRQLERMVRDGVGQHISGNTQIKGELYSYGDVTLGWTKLSDSIMVYDYRSAHSLKIADGQEMTDGNHIYSGSLDLSELRWQLSGETLTPYVGTQWQTLQYRIDHAENGDTVTLDDNITATAEDTALRIPAGKTITLDLNGYTLDRNLDSAATDGSAIINNGTLTIDDSSRSGNGTAAGTGPKTLCRRRSRN